MEIHWELFAFEHPRPTRLARLVVVRCRSALAGPHRALSIVRGGNVEDTQWRPSFHF
jgi:hypothetical protein